MQQTTRCTVSETGHANPKGEKKTVKNCHKLGENHENCNPGMKLGEKKWESAGKGWQVCPAQNQKVDVSSQALFQEDA